MTSPTPEPPMFDRQALEAARGPLDHLPLDHSVLSDSLRFDMSIAGCGLEFDLSVGDLRRARAHSRACLSAWPAESAVEAALRAFCGIEEPCGKKRCSDGISGCSCMRAALLAAGLHANARIAELEAENARLREGLKPFADMGVGSGPGHETETYRIERDAIRTARKLVEDRT